MDGTQKWRIYDPESLLDGETMCPPDDCPFCVGSPCIMCRMISDAIAFDLIGLADAVQTNKYARAKWGFAFSICQDCGDARTHIMPLPRGDRRAAIVTADECRMSVRIEKLGYAGPSLQKCMDPSPFDVIRCVMSMFIVLEHARPSADFFDHVIRERATRVQKVDPSLEAMTFDDLKDLISLKIGEAKRKAMAQEPASLFAHIHDHRVELLLPVRLTESAQPLFAPVTASLLIRTLIDGDAGASNACAMLGAWAFELNCPIELPH